MSHSINENFCTYEELRDFTNNFVELSILNLSAFLETKTKKEEYCIVKRKMLYELKNALFDNNLAIFDVQRFLNEIWEKYNKDEHTKGISKEVASFLTKKWADVVQKNTLITDRWAVEFKQFD